jgi:hypothetical protein
VPPPEPARRGWTLPLVLAGIVVAGVAYSLAGRRPPSPPSALVVPAAPAGEARPHESPAVVEPRPAEPIAAEPPPVAHATAVAPPPPAEASGRPPGEGAMQACKADAETYCPGITPGDGRFAACMRDNLHRFSEACRPLALQRFRPRPPRN